jgi:hypothetical protein
LCNFYSLTKGQQAIRELSRAMADRTGNMPPLPGIFPDYANRSFVVSPSFTFRTEVQRVQMPAKNANGTTQRFWNPELASPVGGSGSV